MRRHFFAFILIFQFATVATAAHAAEKIRVAYPAVAPGSRLEKDLRPSESISFHYEMAALDDPRAAKFSVKEFWDPSLVEEIRRSGFVEQLDRQ